MEEEWAPFELIDRLGRTTLYLHGTKDEHKRLDADGVMKIRNAIKRGWSVYISYADIDGDIYMTGPDMAMNEQNVPVIAGSIEIIDSNVNGNMIFVEASFEQSVYLSGSRFRQSVSFMGSSFKQRPIFDGAIFYPGVNFSDVDMKYPASFVQVRLRENTVPRGIWNYILRPLLWPLVWLLSIGKVKLPKATVTNVRGINTDIVMDASSNPRLKRYIDDEQWIYSWRTNPKGRWWREPVFRLWELTSHCGRSIGLWMFWWFVLALVFGFLHKDHIYVDPNTVRNWYTSFYFSVVTFTTLGFGGVRPIDSLGQLWITLEVLAGYLMLGGLISILANKFARRS